MELDRDEARALERRLETQGRSDDWEPVSVRSVLWELVLLTWAAVCAAASLVRDGVKESWRDDAVLLCASGALLLWALGLLLWPRGLAW